MTQAEKTIIDILGLEKLSSEDQKKAFEIIGQTIFQSVFLRVMDELDDEQKKEFETVLEGAKNEQEIFAFLEQHVPHVDDIMREETERFKAEIGVLLQKLG